MKYVPPWEAQTMSARYDIAIVNQHSPATLDDLSPALAPSTHRLNDSVDMRGRRES